jgi:site-specific DNA-methyltransferase (cytosine-N4-specific)
MSGSGTTAVEANLSGCAALGLDMNPLSVFLGLTKCELLSVQPEELRVAYSSARSLIADGKTHNGSQLSYLGTLPKEDQEYLKGWFDTKVLTDLDDVASAIRLVESTAARNLMWVSLSNILRSVSWQRRDDLRVRKEVRLDVEIHAKKQFLEEFGRSIRAVLGFLYQEGPVRNAFHRIEEGDARQCHKVWQRYSGNIDVVITSPPYATALPYLDTDRLSLCYLGLLCRREQRYRDQVMIGNREVTQRLRREYQAQFKFQGSELPLSVQRLISQIEDLNKGTAVGFRRTNLPALLSKYFFDMRDVLSGIREILKPGGIAFVVVGNNHTIAGGRRVEIQTAKLLSEIAQTLEFEALIPLSMDMLVSRDIFRRNAVSSEEILAFRKPKTQI